MTTVTHIGIDLAKTYFHVFCADERGQAVIQKRIHRSDLMEFMATVSVSTIAMEACGSAHHWARQFEKLGHDVKLIHPGFVKPFVKGNKNDSNDAEGIYEASVRPRMRFVPVKTVEQQDILAIHRTREILIRQRTQLVNQIRGLLAERGHVAPQGRRSLMKLITELLSDEGVLTPIFEELLTEMKERLVSLDERRLIYDRKLRKLSQENETCKRLTEIPGIGPICSTALYATVGKGRDFKNGREMAAWLGLVPRQETTGGKPKLLGISKRGDRYLRKQLIHGARSMQWNPKGLPEARRLWLANLESRRHKNVAAVALANKQARIAWALLSTGQTYRTQQVA